MKRWGEKPYVSLDYYYRQMFHEKVYKISINAGFTCPNRDGTLGTGGCIFCSAGGSGDFAGDATTSITKQLNQGIKNIGQHWNVNKYIAYFQAFTNTYGPIPKLRHDYFEALNYEKVCGISIATRPDCLPEEVLDLLEECNQIKPVWVELGLQTIHEDTAKYIRRGYTLPVFEMAVKELRKRNISVVVHVILGLPGENREKVKETIEYLNDMDIQGIKLQLLHVISGTDLAIDFQQGKFSLLSEDDYVAMVCDCISILREDIVIHRLTGDGPSELLLGPLWSTRKMEILNQIHKELKIRKIWQGCRRNYDSTGDSL